MINGDGHYQLHRFRDNNISVIADEQLADKFKPPLHVRDPEWEDASNTDQMSTLINIKSL